MTDSGVKYTPHKLSSKATRKRLAIAKSLGKPYQNRHVRKQEPLVPLWNGDSICPEGETWFQLLRDGILISEGCTSRSQQGAG